ncbi:H-NS family nucleoid-associated regulatory protein [Variovorax sp. ZT4R33]|uniref:H-NS family nucleoid-associated regulatory protein n=1 Tax=Variovorax sp. ZT4R33 TaxID=3443743 RepID=UPI003F46F8BB
MTQNYQQIQRQIEALQRQAEKLKTKEVAGVIERIKVAIAHYGLTPEQLGFGTSQSTSRKAVKSDTRSVSKDAGTAKYADGQGKEWSGRGPRPRWLRDALAAGKSLEDFATSSPANVRAQSTRAMKTTKAAPKRTAQHYRDQSGNSWTGFGPKPRWLKEALAAGGTLDQFIAN